MPARTLLRSRLSIAEAISTFHLLAALNHRQWSRMQAHVLPLLEHDSLSSEEIILSATASTEKEFGGFANGITAITGHLQHKYAHNPINEVLIERKKAQLRSWLDFALDSVPVGLDLWRLKSATPFLDLAPREQSSDYDEAVLDLLALARATGLVLPEQLPTVRPRTGVAAAWLRAKHAAGKHSGYMISETAWSYTCQACEAGKGVDRL